MIPSDWYRYRRSDGEALGYIETVGEAYRPYDLLGRPAADVGEWLEAEDVLERVGLAWLAAPHEFLPPGEASSRRVRITEVTREHVRLVDDAFGGSQDMSGPERESWILPLPLQHELRPIA